MKARFLFAAVLCLGACTKKADSSSSSGGGAGCDGVTTCQSGDTCCPTGCNAATDTDCKPVCGNGVVETGELCDGDSCPTSCQKSTTTCFANVLQDANTCQATCAATAITTCVNNDGCCAPGCNNQNDSDCLGVLGDACDTDAQCASQFCLLAWGFTKGYCSVDCTLSGLSACTSADANSHCNVGENTQRQCVKNCTGDSDCRQPEYGCFDADGDGTTECAPLATSTTAHIGDPCTTTADCPGGKNGSCQTALTNGDADGYCVEGPCGGTGAQDYTCPGGSHCSFKGTFATDSGICVQDCGASTDCRSTGYDCYDADNNGSEECAVAGTAEDGTAPTGHACSTTADCSGGPFVFCFQLWPDGFCTKRCEAGLAGTCDPGSTCHVFNAASSNSYSRCFAECTVAAANCTRTGYSCEDVGDASNECFGPPVY